MIFLLSFQGNSISKLLIKQFNIGLIYIHDQ